jgi:hypothetical protein
MEAQPTDSGGRESVSRRAVVRVGRSVSRVGVVGARGWLRRLRFGFVNTTLTKTLQHYAPSVLGGVLCVDNP